MKLLVSNSALIGVNLLLDENQVDPIPLLKRANLPLNALTSDSLVLDPKGVNQFIEDASKACNDRYFALKMAKHQGWFILGDIWTEMCKGKTLGDALEVLCHYIDLHTTSITSYLKPEPKGMSLCYEVRWHNTRDQLMDQGEILVSEMGLAISCLEIRRLIGQSWYPKYTLFRHKAPKPALPLEKVFGKNISFNQDSNAIFLSHEDLNTELTKEWIGATPARNPTDNTLGLSTSSLLSKTDKIIRKINADHCCTVDEVAEELGLTIRTLQYQLKKEGKSYQQLLDQIRIESSIHYLKDSSLSITEISERLHFSEPAVFSRFFKKHTGATPKQLRAQYSQDH